MIETIEKALVQQSQDHNVKIVYACESGSRAWGFASPDSDYDVRFIYAHPQDWYLSLFPGRDVIEKPIDKVLDVSGWDLRKALVLLHKSNCALIEWIHSPIVYVEMGDIGSSLQKLAAHAFRPESACHHYLGMAKKVWRAAENKEQIKLKRYFYTLRALFCCEWIADQKSIPPVRFLEIVDCYYPQGAIHNAIAVLLEKKANTNESDKLNRAEYAEVLRVLDARILELFNYLPKAMPGNPDQDDKTMFEQTFRSILQEQK